MQSSLQGYTAAAAQRAALTEVSRKVLQQLSVYTLHSSDLNTATWKTALIIQKSLDQDAATTTHRAALEAVNMSCRNERPLHYTLQRPL